jgi:murein DD-endopeptidase MepM/ murein hydrolase activator NlpD
VAQICASLLLAGVMAAATAPSLTISVDARSIQPGELVVLTVQTSVAADSVRVRAFNRDHTAFKIDPTSWRALVGIDLDVAPGSYSVSVEAGPPLPPTTTIHRLVVRPKAFPTRRLKVDDAFVNPPPSVLARIDEEARLLASLWNGSAETRFWTGAFVRPVPQAANSAFGSRSVLNGVARSPHGGADFASPAGTPVRSPNTGRVVLAKALYYTGNTVVIDHGAGLFSLFAHLSALSVREGETVDAGAILGDVGATGRVTGPHLHWTVRAGGARVDPLSLLALLGST